MKDCKSIIANIAFEVCAFLKTKRLTSKVVKIQIDVKFEKYLINCFRINSSRFKQVHTLITRHKLKRFFSHKTNSGYVKLTEFVVKLNKIKVLKLQKRKNELTVKSPITLSIRLAKCNYPDKRSLESLINFDNTLRNRI